MKKEQASIIFNGSVFFFLLFTYFFLIPNFIRLKAGVRYGPELFPKLVTLILIAFSLVITVREYVAFKKAGGSFSHMDFNFKAYIPHTLFIVSGVLFLYAAKYFGFVIAAVPFMLFWLYIFGSKNKILSIVVAILYPIALVWLFSGVMRIPFPRGIFGI